MADDKTAADCVEAWHAYRHGPRYQDSEAGRFNSRVPFEHGFDAGAAWQAEQAAVRRVAPDRETLYEADLVEWRAMCVRFPGSTLTWRDEQSFKRAWSVRWDRFASGVLGVPADATSRTEYALDYRAGIMCASDERADAEEMQQFIPDSFIVRRTVTETDWEPDGPSEESDHA